MKAYITLFGASENISQNVDVVFEMDANGLEVNYCKIITPISISPTDLMWDLLVGIAERIDEIPDYLAITCDIKCSLACTIVYKEPKVILEEIGV